jgi:hypothetical protein
VDAAVVQLRFFDCTEALISVQTRSGLPGELTFNVAGAVPEPETFSDLSTCPAGSVNVVTTSLVAVLLTYATSVYCAPPSQIFQPPLAALQLMPA